MKFLKQLTLIMFFYVIGEIISYLIKLVFPAIIIPSSIIGMLLLLILLLTKIIKFKWIDSVGDFFLKNMAFFFVPSIVSLLAYFDIITPILWKLILILFISFILTFISVGFSAKLTIYLTKKKGGN